MKGGHHILAIDHEGEDVEEVGVVVVVVVVVEIEVEVERWLVATARRIGVVILKLGPQLAQLQQMKVQDKMPSKIVINCLKER